MDLRQLSAGVESELNQLFNDEMDGISSREDSRAFGAMIEKKITDNWKKICGILGYKELEMPGRRTIYDFGLLAEGQTIGIDVKTKDLDSKSYSDGGICAVGNLLKFLSNDNGQFLIAEFGHNKSISKGFSRDIRYIKVAPFTLLPKDAYRIENLGTGQVRLNCTLSEAWPSINWERNKVDFYELFIDLACNHYRRVSKDALRRIESLQMFRVDGYNKFTFSRG